MIENSNLGKSKAALQLSKMLENDVITRRKIIKNYNNFSRTLNELSKIDSRIALGLAKTVLEQYRDRSVLYQTNVRTFFFNVIKTKYKIWLIKEKGQMTYNNRGRK